MQESDFYKKFEHFLFGSLLHKISVYFLNSEGGIRLRGSSFLPGEAVSLQLGVVLVVFSFSSLSASSSSHLLGLLCILHSPTPSLNFIL